MDHGSENSKVPFVEQQLYTLPNFSYPSFSLFTPNNHTLFPTFCPLFSTMEFNDLNNSNCFTPSVDSSGYCDILGEHSCAESDTFSSNEEGDDASDEEMMSLDELQFDGKTKEKIELLAAMVGVDTTDPAIVLNEAVRVLKVLKSINQY